MGELGCFEQFALLNQVQPVWNVVVYRALPFAIRVAAVETAPGLLGRVGAIELTVDLAVVLHALFRRLLFRVATRYFKKL